MVEVRGAACAVTLVVALTGAATGGSPAHGQPSIRVTPLVGLGGPGSHAWAVDVNERGVAVGSSTPGGSGGRHAVVWDGPAPTDLTPDLVDPSGVAQAHAVNDRGAILGGRSGSGAEVWLWEDGAGGGRTTLPADTGYGVPEDLTERGLALYGQADRTTLGGGFGGVAWRDGRRVVAPVFPGLPAPLPFFGLDVNERGLAVGMPAIGQPPVPGTWRIGGAVTPLPLPDGAVGGVATAVNDRGDIAGVGLAPGTWAPQALRWRDGQVEELAALDGGWTALDDDVVDDTGASVLNRWGDVVGAAGTAAGGSHAVLWRGDGPLVDLGTLGGDSAIAVGVNDRRQVVGHSATGSGEVHGFLWDDGEMVDLTALTGTTGRTTITDITDGGHVVGHVQGADGIVRSYRWDVG